MELYVYGLTMMGGITRYCIMKNFLKKVFSMTGMCSETVGFDYDTLCVPSIFV